MKVKRLLVFAGKLGYQTRSFDAVARKLGVELVFVTDRCHLLDDPWGDRAIAVHFESPEVAAYTVLEVARAGERVDGILALGDRPAVAAAFVRGGLGLGLNHPFGGGTWRSKMWKGEGVWGCGLEGPFFEETIYVTPSRLGETQRTAIEKCAADAARALGLSHGPVHAEFRINEEGVWPLEVAPRPIGGLCARALQFVSGECDEVMGLEELLLRHAVEMPVGDWKRETAASGVMMIPVPASGVLESVEGEELARAVPHIVGLEITARLHDYIAAWPEGSSYLGFLFARAETAGEVEAALRAAHEKLRFAIRERLAVEHPATRRVVG